jgi:hypothetical protein
MLTQQPPITNAKQELAVRAATHDAAKRLAVELRRQAMDDLWSALGHALRTTWLRASRATRGRAVIKTEAAPPRTCDA